MNKKDNKIIFLSNETISKHLCFHHPIVFSFVFLSSLIFRPGEISWIMCTIGGLGRHIGRQSTDYRSTIDRLSVDSRPIVDRLSADISADCRPMHQPICAHLSVDCRPIYRSTVGRSIGRLSTDRRSTVDR